MFTINIWRLGKRCVDIGKNSSGGISSILAEHIINQNGSVYGVVLNDEKNEAEHRRGTSFDDIACFLGSKYLQSNVGDTYLEVKKDLLNNKLVFYTGTPCQIAGIYSFLGKDHEKLLTADLICHGVFSKNIYKKEVAYWARKYKGTVKNFRFRCKRKYHWSYGGVVSFDVYRKNKLYKKVDMLGKFSPMYYSFAYANDYMILRPSCYNCKYRSTNRIADVTLGDFWRLEKSHPEQALKNINGVSLVFLNSEKGNKVFNQVIEKIVFF